MTCRIHWCKEAESSLSVVNYCWKERNPTTSWYDNTQNSTSLQDFFHPSLWHLGWWWPPISGPTWQKFPSFHQPTPQALENHLLPPRAGSDSRSHWTPTSTGMLTYQAPKPPSPQNKGQLNEGCQNQHMHPRPERSHHESQVVAFPQMLSAMQRPRKPKPFGSATLLSVLVSNMRKTCNDNMIDDQIMTCIT